MNRFFNVKGAGTDILPLLFNDSKKGPYLIMAGISFFFRSQLNSSVDQCIWFLGMESPLCLNILVNKSNAN